MTHTLVSRVLDNLEQFPERKFFTFVDLARVEVESVLTYSELCHQAFAFAAHLTSGPRESRVLIVLPLSPRLICAHLGVIFAGQIPIIHSHPSQKTGEQAYSKHLAHVISTITPQVLITNQLLLDGLRRFTSLDDIEIILEESVAEEAAGRPSNLQKQNPDAIALIQQSSGSTGLQKGVALTHQMILKQCESYSRAIALDPGNDRICSWIPLYHDMGLFTTWLMPLLHGVPVFAIDPFEWIRRPVSFLNLIHQKRGTLSWQPNFAFNVLSSAVSETQSMGLDLSCMRGWTSCSEPVRADTFKLFLSRFSKCGVSKESLWSCYAMAENSFAVSTNKPEDGARIISGDRSEFSKSHFKLSSNAETVEIVSTGFPVEGCEVQILGENDSKLQDNEIGEVAVRGEFTIKEYFRRPDLRAVDGGGWFRTGDCGFIHEGEIFITGRKKDVLIVAGRNFWPHDIEAICDSCPDSIPGRSVALGQEDSKTGTERIIVILESHSTDPEKRETLKKEVRNRVFQELDCTVNEVHVVPSRWLLKTTSGKIARKPNLERFLSEGVKRESAIPAWKHWCGDAIWGMIAAAALAVWIASATNPSWGVYAKF